LNLGDSYWGGKGASSQAWSTEMVGKRETINGKQHQIATKGETRPTDRKHEIIKPKDLIGIPWMVAFALRADGWYLRQDIIWHKPNPMPESVTDRCTKSHEYIFLLSKSQKYYYDSDSIKTKMICSEHDKRTRDSRKCAPTNMVNGIRSGNESVYEYVNKRSVWTVNTKPFTEAHFATFPEDLIVDMIKAGCPEGGLIYDPFMGAGTTALVALKLDRQYIGSELNPEYCKIAERRLLPHRMQQKIEF
jgi:DNA modification methylase